MTPEQAFAELDKHVTAHFPELPYAQSRSVATYLSLGWIAMDVGRYGEVNIETGPAMTKERGYIRPDGIYRPS